MRFIGFVFLFVISAFGKELYQFDTLAGDFRQKVFSPSGAKVEYDGKVYIKGNNILWKYQNPIQKNVYVKDTFVIVDEIELEQAIFTSISSELNLISMLKKAQKISNDKYKVNFNNTVYFIYLKKQTLSKIVYKDQMDNKIEIIFEKLIQNKELKNDLFNFVPPKDYDIIRK